ncbi:carboxypeptidase-like regulatory domain-containing protein [Flaviaesturariibacter terrae]
MHRLLFAFLLCFGLPALAQVTLRGTVLDATSGQPLPGASVFLSNTSVGTTANSRGEFELPVPAGKYDLVVSAVDHETYSRALGNEGSAPLVVRLKPRVQELETVVIQPYEKNGWKKWGQFFLDNFMGTSEEAAHCIIRNKETLRFRLDTRANTLTAVAREPLIIENKRLGYRIRYQLEDFSFHFGTHIVTFFGYPLYEDLGAGKARTHKWDEARRRVYEGSMMHFMRALYRNQLIEEGFTLYRVRKIPNLAEVARVKPLENGRLFFLRNGSELRSDDPDDSLRAWQPQVGREPVLTVVDGHRLVGDSLAYAGDSSTAVLDFPNYIVVLYDKGKTPESYRKTVRNGNFAMQSELCLLNGRPVLVESNGYYYSPLDLIANGWLGWTEKIGRMLPFDYKP